MKMKNLKTYEDFKNNNLEGSLITQDDIINCIHSGGVVFATIVKDFPDNDPEVGMRAVSIDEYGLVTVEYEGNEYEIELENIKTIEY